MITDSRFMLVLLLFTFNTIKAQTDFITINGKKVEVSISGFENNKRGRPVIVFENGRGSTFGSWDSVVNVVSHEYVTFRYNRPRLGKSEDDNVLPTMKYIVDLVREMLQNKGLEPPYLLVGHSFGASYIRSFASYYPEELAGVIFVDPGDFTKKQGMGRLPYEEYGLSKLQIDSLFESFDQFGKAYMKNSPGHIVPELKVSSILSETNYEECVHRPLPDIPVHFIEAGGFKSAEGDSPAIISDTERLFRINTTITRKRFMELLYPLKYGRYFYTKCSGHCIQCDDPEIVISSIKIAMSDFNTMKME